MRAESLLGHASELLGQMLRSAQPPDAVVQDYFRRRSYLGSKERRFLAEATFATLRCLGVLRWCLERQPSPPVPCSPEWLLLVAMGYLGARLGHPHLGLALAQASQRAEEEVDQLWEEVVASAGWGKRARAWLEALWQQVCIVERELQLLLDRPFHEWDEAQWQLFAAGCSFPAWILRRWMDNPWAALSSRHVVQLCRAFMAPAFPCLRVNTLRATRDEVLHAMRQRGIGAAPTPFSPVGIRLWQRTAVHTGELYRSGVLEVQEEASQLVGYAVAPEAEWRLWDACAGAGGKTLHLAMLQGDRGEIWATDIDALRLRALQHRVRRARLRSVRVRLLRMGANFPSDFPRRFHALLVDAPCSGIGTVRRTPTLKWRLTPEALHRHRQRQLHLLHQYAERVMPGGILIYATCSVMPEENFGVVEDFLAHHPEWESEPLEPIFRTAGIELPWALPQRAECLLLPSIHGTDGFFIARLRRRR